MIAQCDCCRMDFTRGTDEGDDKTGGLCPRCATYRELHGKLGMPDFANARVVVTVERRGQSVLEYRKAWTELDLTQAALTFDDRVGSALYDAAVALGSAIRQQGART